MFIYIIVSSYRYYRQRTTEDEMVGWHHQFNGHNLGKLQDDGEGQGDLACCRPWGCKESDTTWWLNNDIFLYNPRNQFHQLLLSSVLPLLSTFPTPDPHVILGGNKESRAGVRDIHDLLACDTCSQKSTWGLVYLGWWGKPTLMKWGCEQKP